MVGLAGYGARMPAQLSGGQQQRVALARVLATDPRVLLFDEPLSALDKNLRDTLKYSILELQRRTGKTAIYVTHDQSEAFAISDRIVVMNAGRVEQIGTQTDIYLRPETPFVAEFIGANNALPGTRDAAIEGSRRARHASHGVDVERASDAPQPGPTTGCAIGDRGDRLPSPGEHRRRSTTATAPTSRTSSRATIERVIFEGPTAQLRVDVGGRELRADVSGDQRLTLVAGSRPGPARVQRRDRDRRPGASADRPRGRSPDVSAVTASLRRAASRPCSGASSWRELPNFVHRPYLVVTMADLWPRFEAPPRAAHLAGVHLVDEPRAGRPRARRDDAARAPPRSSGWVAARPSTSPSSSPGPRRLPLFQVPTATTVNAPFGHRAGLRDRGRVRYLGWAIPEAVYVDFDVIAVGAAGPQPERRRRRPLLPHRALRLAARRPPRPDRAAAGRTTQGLVADAATVIDSVVDALDEIRDGQRGGHPGARPGPSLGRHDVPRLGLEPAPHRGRRALLLLQPRAASPAATSSMASRSGWGSSPAPSLQDNEPERMAGRPRPGRRRHPARRRWASPGTTSARRCGRCRRTSATPACGSASPTRCPITDDHVARVRELVEAAFGRGRRDERRTRGLVKIGLTPAAGLRPRVPRAWTRPPPGSGRSRSPAGPRTLGFESLWVNDHMQVDPPPEEAPIFEPFVELAALAVATSARPPRPPRPGRGVSQRRA